MPLSVLHFADSDLSGGAARAASRTHGALRDAGVRSQMVVRNRDSDDPLVHHVPAYLNPWRWRAREIRRRLPLIAPKPPPRSRHYFDFDVDMDIRKQDMLAFDRADADVIYLHHTRFLLTSRDIARIYDHYRVPMTWTLHSLAPLTGGCCYPLGCQKYEDVCVECPQLLSDRSRAATIQERRRRLLAPLPIVFIAPSAWSAEHVHRSSTFRDHRVEVIPNPIDETIFTPADRPTLRRELSIPEDALALCVSAVNFTNYFKGTEILTEALTAVWNSVDDATRSRIRVVAIGGGADALADAQPFPCIALGQLDGDAAVAKAYQAADMFVCPSRAENGVQTIPEALLTGTPVVSFPVGGAADVIEHGVNGYLAAQGSAADLAEGIRTFLARAGDSAVAAAARAAGLRHARATVAATHLALCDELVAAHRAPVTTRRPVTPAG
jgi:glycosyltransferase involved in cell wall biosynthesis